MFGTSAFELVNLTLCQADNENSVAGENVLPLPELVAEKRAGDVNLQSGAAQNAVARSLDQLLTSSLPAMV